MEAKTTMIPSAQSSDIDRLLSALQTGPRGSGTTCTVGDGAAGSLAYLRRTGHILICK